MASSLGATRFGQGALPSSFPRSWFCSGNQPLFGDENTRLPQVRKKKADRPRGRLLSHTSQRPFGYVPKGPVPRPSKILPIWKEPTENTSSINPTILESPNSDTYPNASSHFRIFFGVPCSLTRPSAASPSTSQPGGMCVKATQG